MLNVFMPWSCRRRVARVAFNLRPRKSAYGGGNQFVSQLARALELQSYDVAFDLDGHLDAVILIDPRREHTTWGLEDLESFRRAHPAVPCLHRINECDVRKGTSGMDELLARANALADYTVFVSGWLRDHHAARWFDARRPHRVILNGADPRVFHPMGRRKPAADTPFRVATHHWSDNPNKGFAVYQAIDEQIATGGLAGFELWVIGRWPKDMKWQVARTHPAAYGAALARLLRECQAYVTASRWDPGPMHVVEAMQCGLPVAYASDGGGIPEMVAERGLAIGADVGETLVELRRRMPEMAPALLSAVGGDGMCAAYRQEIERLIVRGRS